MNREAPGPDGHAAACAEAPPDESVRPAAFLGILLAVDAALVLLLDKIGWAAAALAGAGVVAFWLARVEWLLAFLLLGLPLLWPLGLRPAASEATYFGICALLFPATWLALRASRSSWRASLSRLLSEPAALLVLALALLLWVRLPASPAPEYGAGKLKSFLIANAILFFAPALLWPVWRERARVDRLLRALLVVGGLFVAAGAVYALGWADWLSRSEPYGGGAPGVPGRLGWLGIDPIWTARALAVWIVLLAWSAARRLLRPWLAATFAFPAFPLLFATGSRGPLGALLLAPLALLALPGARRLLRLKNLVRLLVPLALAAAVALLLLPGEDRDRLLATVLRTPLGSIVGATGAEMSATIEGAALRDASVLYRVQIIERGLTALRDALPWGAGTGGFPALLFLRDVRLYPHNIEAELAIELGLPGLALFLAFLVLVWRRARVLAAREPSHAGLFALFAMAFLNAQVSGDLSGNALLWFWGGAICAVACAARAPAGEPGIRA